MKLICAWWVLTFVAVSAFRDVSTGFLAMMFAVTAAVMGARFADAERAAKDPA